MPDHEQDPIRRRLAQLQDQRANAELTGVAMSAMDGLNPIERRLMQMGAVRPSSTQVPEEDEGPGFFASVGGLFQNQDRGAQAGAVARQTIASGFIAPLQGLAQIPGFLTSRDLPTDRAANYLQRVRVGLETQAEEIAATAGMSTEAIAGAKLLGEMIGFTVPTVAALKAARLVTGIQGPILTLSRNFVLDTTAGAIYGAALTPNEQLADRGVSMLNESALFGVGGLMINGLVFAAQGMRFNRVRRGRDAAHLESVIKRIQNGEQVEFTQREISLLDLMSEDGFLASSPQAHAMLAQYDFDQAILAGMQNMAESGETRTIIRSFSTDFADATAAVARMKEAQPHMKFDVIKRGDVYDVHAGLKGLNNQQRAQLKREGRFAGQIVEKNGSRYEYVRLGKNGRLVVKTADGKVAALKPDGVTDIGVVREELELPTVGKALYEDFRTFIMDRIRSAAGVSGPLSERDLVRGFRDGTLTIADDMMRSFEIPGAITHPVEIGLLASQIMKRSLDDLMGENAPGLDALAGMAMRGTIRQGDNAYHVLENAAYPQGSDMLGRFSVIRAADSKMLAGFDAPDQMWVFIDGEQIPLQQAVELAQSGDAAGALAQEAGSVLQEIMETLQRGDQLPPGPLINARRFIETVQQRGKGAGDLLQPTPIRNTDDAFMAWINERGLTPDAEDLGAFRSSFNQQLRDDIWRMAPDEDMARLRQIREEIIANVEAKELPFEALAHLKGFNTERMPDGRIALRDINTGARIQFGSETFAREGLTHIVRAEKDFMHEFLTTGNMGIPGFTGGFDATDGIWFFPDHILSGEFMQNVSSGLLRNRRDYLLALEEYSDVPFFSQGYAKIDEGLIRMNDRFEPLTNRISNIWKGIKRDDRILVADFWQSIESEDLTGAALTRAAREFGLNNKQIRAFVQSRAMFDMGAQMIGLPKSRYIQNYYSRIRPMNESGKQRAYRDLLSDDPIAMKEFEFWAEMTRSGELPRVEKDPEIVMHRYFRAMMFKQEVAPHEAALRKITETRIKDLPADKQKKIMERALEDTTPESHVLPDPIRATLNEYMNAVRGDMNARFATARAFTSRTAKHLGMEVDGKLFDELHSTYLSMQYGAAIGLRFSLANRNAVQNLWMMYTRLGGKYGTESMRRALTQTGYDEAIMAQAVRATDATLPYHDAIFDNWIKDPSTIKGTGPLSMALAAGIRRSLRLGLITRKTAQKFLVPYGSTDQVQRAWAFHWQKMHTDEWLTKFESGKISWDSFMEDGLPFFSDKIKQDFRQHFDRLGRNDALDYIGKQAADEANFIYGAGTSPGFMQSPFGRLAGVFGQWPIWAFETYRRAMGNGTPKQIGAFWARNLVLVGAFANMTSQTGIDMWNWMAPFAFEYAGGPFLDTVENLRQTIQAPVDQKGAALQRLASDFGSLALPGQIFFHELGIATEQTSPQQAALTLMLGRPVDQDNFNWDWVLNGEAMREGNQLPATQRRQLDVRGLPRIEDLISGSTPSGVGGRSSASLSVRGARPVP